MLNTIALFLTGCVMPRDTTGLHTALERNDLKKYRCTMGAHRGDSVLYTENSPRAVRSARENPRFAFIEFDVQYSEDNVPVIVHDGNLLRVFGHMNKVRNSSFEELQKLSGGEIVTYDEIMDLADGKRVNIEIKSQGDEMADEQLVDFVMKDVRERGLEKKVLISSISEEAVAYVKTNYPGIKAGQIFFLGSSTVLPFDFLMKRLFQSPADYLMLYTANARNIVDLLKLKPENKTLVFWDFGDTMYIVHKDFSDRLWGESGTKNFFDWIRYKISWKRSVR